MLELDAYSDLFEDPTIFSSKQYDDEDPVIGQTRAATAANAVANNNNNNNNNNNQSNDNNKDNNNSLTKTKPETEISSSSSSSSVIKNSKGVSSNSNSNSSNSNPSSSTTETTTINNNNDNNNRITNSNKRKRNSNKDNNNNNNNEKMDTTESEIEKRKERNKEHAKRSRQRRKFLLESLRDQLIAQRKLNDGLRQIVIQKLPRESHEILEKCSSSSEPNNGLLNTGLPDVLHDHYHHLLGDNNTNHNNNNTDGSNNNNNNNNNKLDTISENDKKLMTVLNHSQQCFTLCMSSDPHTIIYASEGFLKLTGYPLQHVIGRNMLFLQRKATQAEKIAIIQDGMMNSRDTSVCLLNFKADGTPFWNQFFVAPLCDANENAIFFVGVHSEIEEASLDSELQAVIKRVSVEDMENELELFDK